MKYTLCDFENYIKNNDIKKLNNDTLTIIENIVNKLQKKQNFGLNNLNYTTENALPVTKIIKPCGLNINLFNIRKYLNIITYKNYNIILNNISNEFDEVITNKTQNDVLILCELFYEISSSNILLSSLYATLYKDIIDKSDYLTNITNNIQLYKKMIDDITYFDPDNDYDNFCENNKLNEKIRAKFTFLSNLMNHDIIDYNIVYDFIEYSFFKLNYFIKDGKKKNELNELSELIYILVFNSFKKIKDNNINKYNNIVELIKTITNLTIKTSPGLTNKCIFKHIDLLEQI